MNNYGGLTFSIEGWGLWPVEDSRYRGIQCNGGFPKNDYLGRQLCTFLTTLGRQPIFQRSGEKGAIVIDFGTTKNDILKNHEFFVYLDRGVVYVEEITGVNPDYWPCHWIDSTLYLNHIKKRGPS